MRRRLTDQTTKRSKDAQDPEEPPPARPRDTDVSSDERSRRRTRKRSQSEPVNPPPPSQEHQPLPTTTSRQLGPLYLDSQSHSNSPPISIPNISQQRSRIRQRTTSKRPAQEPEDQDGCDVFTEGATDLETDVTEKGDDEDGSTAE